jgi:hypothetical protein
MNNANLASSDIVHAIRLQQQHWDELDGILDSMDRIMTKNRIPEAEIRLEKLRMIKAVTGVEPTDAEVREKRIADQYGRISQAIVDAGPQGITHVDLTRKTQMLKRDERDAIIRQLVSENLIIEFKDAGHRRPSLVASEYAPPTTK